MNSDALGKVHIFWEDHNILRNLHRRFVLCSNGQIYDGDFAKFCVLLRIYELYLGHQSSLQLNKLVSILKLFYNLKKKKSYLSSKNILCLCWIATKVQRVHIVKFDPVWTIFKVIQVPWCRQNCIVTLSCNLKIYCNVWNRVL